MKNFKIFFIALVVVIPITSYGESLISGLSLLDMTGNEVLQFKSSGDFIWANAGQKNIYGAFTEGSQTCWTENKDGTKNNVGNIIVYIGDIQCCLSTEKITGKKISLTKIWVKGTGPDYSMCKNGIYCFANENEKTK